MKLTREGKGLAVTGLLVAMAALNTGNNLIYLLTAVMISLGILDLVAGYLNLKKLNADIEIPEPIYAGVSLPVAFRFVNGRKRIPAFLIRFSGESGIHSPTAGRVDPGAELVLKSHVRFVKRGRLDISGFTLSSAYPFGFFRNRVRLFNNSRFFLVYPELTDVRGLLTGIKGAAGSGALPHPSGEDFTDIRPYRHGDPMRGIHWKATAKSGNLMVKEFRTGISRHVTIFLDNHPGVNPEVFEKGVSLAASLAELLFSEGYPVCVDSFAQSFGPARSREQLYRIMDFLAVVQPEAPDLRIVDEESGVLLLVQCGSGFLFPKLLNRASGVFHAVRL